MKRNLFRILGFCGIVGGVIALSSCKKESVTPVPRTVTGNQVTAAMNNSVNEATGISIQMISMLLSGGDGNMSGKMESVATCATMSIDSSASPRVLTYNWGEGCINSKGEVRKGVVKIRYNFTDLSRKQLRQDGTHVEIDFYNFAIDTTVYNGTLVFNNNGSNGSGNMEFAINSNLSVLKPSRDTTMTINSNLTIEWTEGGATEAKTDDVYSITGTISGVYFDRNSYSVNVIQPVVLKDKETCSDYPVSGIVNGSLTGGMNASIDYGNGTCDNLAKVTKDGVTEVVDLSED